jgi:hypothetical protein
LFNPYLIIGVAVMFLINAATPLSALWLTTVVLLHSFSHGCAHSP